MGLQNTKERREMKEIIQIIIGGICALSTIALIILLIISELRALDYRFSLYFGVLGFVGGVAFFVLARGRDNEETKPAEEKIKKEG